MMHFLGEPSSLTRDTYAAPLGATNAGDGAPLGTGNLIAPGTPDGIGAGWPFQSGAGGGSGGFASTGMLAGLMQTFNNFLQTLFAQLGPILGGTPAAAAFAPSGSAFAPVGTTPPGFVPVAPGSGEQFFTSAHAGSVGDPHDSFDGTTSAGQKIDNRWNDMGAEQDLLCSDSFTGGYRVSTQVTTANKDGVTHNSSATIATNNGKTTVTVNADGTTQIVSNGKSYSLTSTAPVDLGNGETVARDADGGVVVTMTNAGGGKIVTTLTAHDGGVNVRASAENVDLGGYLVDQNPSPTPSPGFPETPIPPTSFGSGLPVPPLSQTPWSPNPDPFQAGFSP